MMVAVREENNGSEDRIIAIAAQSRVPIVVKPCDASLTHVPLRFDSFERTLLLLLLLLLLLSLSSLAFLRLISFPLRSCHFDVRVASTRHFVHCFGGIPRLSLSHTSVGIPTFSTRYSSQFFPFTFNSKKDRLSEPS
jgi:hypothetical protein